MDLVGHRFGSAGVPDEVGASLFALGAERSPGTYELVASLKRAEADELGAACDRDGNLPAARRGELGALVAMLEARLQ